MSGDRIVGIDLGTSNTVVAIVDELDKICVLADGEGNTVHPSVVSFHPSGGVVVGVNGKQRKVLDPRNTIYTAKRMIGQPFDSHAVTETARRVPFQIKEGANAQAMVVTRAGEFAIPEISAIVLDHVRRIASKSLGHEVSRAVVTVPASFTDVQRASTADAGALANLNIVRVLNEPTAAALAYGANKRLSEIIAVYDFGGGTFDITILQLEDQVYTVLGTSGDAFLGGEDIDERLVERMVKTFHQQHGVDLRTDDVSMMRLRAVAEHTKIELSRRSRAVVKVEELAYGKDGRSLDLDTEISRDELVTSIRDLVDRTFASCKESLSLASITPDRISDIILVGGTTRIPFVREQVARFFGKAPRFDINPDDAIATGAALQASSIEQMLDRRRGRTPSRSPVPVDDMVAGVIVGKTPTKPLFGDLHGDKPARAKNESLQWEPPPGSAFSDDADSVDVFPPEPAAPPAPEPSMPDIPLSEDDLMPLGGGPARGRVRTLDDQDFGLPPALDLDVVPPGAGLRLDIGFDPPVHADDFANELDLPPPKPFPTDQAYVLPTHASPAMAALSGDPVPPPRVAAVIDVTPRGLGIATVAGFCEELIRRNSQLPTSVSRSFGTSRDGQDSVRIVVCQGESRRLDNNVVIGDLVLSGLPRRPRGETQIEVEFSIDASGILHVRARDAATGVEQRADLDLKGGMDPDDLAAAARRLQQLANVPVDPA